VALQFFNSDTIILATYYCSKNYCSGFTGEAKCPGRLVKNTGYIREKSLKNKMRETDAFSVAGGMWTTTQ